MLLAVVKDEELVRHLLFALDYRDRFLIAKVRVCMQQQQQQQQQQLKKRREGGIRTNIFLLVKTRCRTGPLVIP